MPHSSFIILPSRKLSHLPDKQWDKHSQDDKKDADFGL
jgi:hypothetical protein